jgi:putative tricarboxylic transport membrane protein
MLTRDRALALAVLLGTLVLAIDSRGIPAPSSWQTYGSALMPQILLAVLGVLGAALLIKSFLPGAVNGPPVVPELLGFVQRNKHILVLFILFGIYVFVLPLVGYLWATGGFLLAALALLYVRTVRRALAAIALAIVVSALIYAIFHYGLRIRLP